MCVSGGGCGSEDEAIDDETDPVDTRVDQLKKRLHIEQKVSVTLSSPCHVPFHRVLWHTSHVTVAHISCHLEDWLSSNKIDCFAVCHVIVSVVSDSVTVSVSDVDVVSTRVTRVPVLAGGSVPHTRPPQVE